MMIVNLWCLEVISTSIHPSIHQEMLVIVHIDHCENFVFVLPLSQFANVFSIHFKAFELDLYFKVFHHLTFYKL